MNDSLPQSGGTYTLKNGELTRTDEEPQPVPFPETLSEEEATCGK